MFRIITEENRTFSVPQLKYESKVLTLIKT